MKGIAMISGIVILLIAIALILLIGGTDLPLAITGAGGACQDIFGFFPSFRCCDESLTASQSNIAIGWGANWQCPPTSSRCRVFPTFTQWYVGSIGCGQGIFGERFCANELPIANDIWHNLQPGQEVFHKQLATVNLNRIEIYSLGLCECGPSPCGEPCGNVLGSTQCGFVTGDNVFDASGNIKQTGVAQPGGFFAYTVPQDDCFTFYPQSNRRVIGNTCEECADTSDCSNRYPSKFNYFGKEYGAICDGTNVQLYDCVGTGPSTCVSWRQDDEGNNIECLEFGSSSRCDLFLAVPVQCCPGTGSCGSQSFCDPDTYTCKATAQCTINLDCGRTVQCDFSTLTLRTPACQNGQCAFDETSVGCCDDVQCAEGWFCDADYSCKEKPTTKQACPFSCCQGEEFYFDRPCPPDASVCCGDNTCAASVEACSTAPQPPLGFNFNIIWIFVFGGLFGLVGFKLGGGIGAGIGAVIGGLVGYAIFWFTTLPLIAQLALTLGGGLLGAGIIYLFIIGIPLLIIIALAIRG